VKTYFLLNVLTGQPVFVFMAERDLARKACDIVRRNDRKQGSTDWHGWEVMEVGVQFDGEEAAA
jgi:hypothetical protein